MTDQQLAGLFLALALVWLVINWVLWRRSRGMGVARRMAMRTGIVAFFFAPLILAFWLLGGQLSSLPDAMRAPPETSASREDQPARSAARKRAPEPKSAESASEYGGSDDQASAGNADRDAGTGAAPPESAAPDSASDVIVLGQPTISELAAPREAAPADDAVAAPTATAPSSEPVVASPPAPPAAAAPPPAAAPANRSNTAARPVPRSAAPTGVAPDGASGFAGTEDYAAVPVFFGTERARDETKPTRVAYTGERGGRVELGRAVVTVPKLNRLLGEVTRPREVTFLGIKIYSETEDPKKHFTLQEIRTLSEAEFIQLVKEQLAKSGRYRNHAFVFVHGYNVEFDSALYRTAQIAYDLEFDGVPFLYSWPSRGQTLEYEYDQNSSVNARDRLKQFLDLVVTQSGADNIHLIAHSMGNVPLLEALREYAIEAAARTAGDSPINQIILAAPDVDRDTFLTIAERIKGVGKGITLYASSTDVAMQASRRYAGGVPRAGDVPATLGPIVMSGIDTIDVSAISTEFMALNHSSYAEKSQLLKDIGQMLLLGLRPPTKRLDVMEQVENAEGVSYWRVKP